MHSLACHGLQLRASHLSQSQSPQLSHLLPRQAENVNPQEVANDLLLLLEDLGLPLLLPQ